MVISYFFRIQIANRIPFFFLRPIYQVPLQNQFNSFMMNIKLSAGEKYSQKSLQTGQITFLEFVMTSIMGYCKKREAVQQ